MANTSGFKGSGITDPFQTPDAPTVDSVSAGVLSADVTISAPTDTGGAAIDSYVVTAKQSDGTSVTGTASAAGTVSVTLTAGGTTTFAAQALNKYGAGQFSGYGNSSTVFTGLELYLWGYNANGQQGRDNGDNNANLSSPTQIASDTTWKLGTAKKRSTSRGQYHSAAITDDGRLFMWGENQSGELGQNNTVNISSPVQVGALTNWSYIDSGEDFIAAVKTDGTLWAWGDNSSGQLGQNNIIDKSSPVQIGSETNWDIVNCGATRIHAVTTDGQWYAWGNSAQGLIADGFVVNRSSPVLIDASSDINVISNGNQQAFLTKNDGTMWSWGRDLDGALGVGGYAPGRTSSPLQIGALTTWSAPSGNGSDAAGAIKTDGTIWAWGENAAGQLGQNNTTDTNSPVQIGSDTNWKQLAGDNNGGGKFVAIRTDGTLWGWGANSRGIISETTVGVSYSSPVQIGSDTGWIVIDHNSGAIFGHLGTTS